MKFKLPKMILIVFVGDYAALGDLTPALSGQKRVWGISRLPTSLRVSSLQRLQAFLRGRIRTRLRYSSVRSSVHASHSLYSTWFPTHVGLYARESVKFGNITIYACMHKVGMSVSQDISSNH